MRSPLSHALLHPLSLAMLALAFISGLCAAWWLFPIGLLFWAIMVFVVYRDPTLRLSRELETRPTVAYRFQAQFERIQKVQVVLHNHLASARPEVRRAFQPIQEQVNQLVDYTHDLCMRMSALENNYKVATMNRDLSGELALIDLKIAQADNEQVRQSYAETRKTLQSRIDSVRQTGSLLEQFDGQLQTLSNTMESLQSDIVRLLAVRKKDARPDITMLQRTLEDQTEQLSSIDAQVTQVQSR
jgi:septation ring formation regulator EzrA